MDALPPATLDSLPASIRDVAEAVGVRLALKLIELFGGLDLYVPHTLREDHPLMALGADDASALCEALGGETIYVPRMAAGPRRTGDVANLAAAGRTRAQIARALGITQRHVRRLARRGEKASDPDQADLFFASDMVRERNRRR